MQYNNTPGTLYPHLLRRGLLLAARDVAEHDLLDGNQKSIKLALRAPHDTLAPLAELRLQLIIPCAHAAARGNNKRSSVEVKNKKRTPRVNETLLKARAETSEERNIIEALSLWYGSMSSLSKDCG